MTAADGRRVAAGMALGVALAAIAWADHASGIAAPIFRALSRQFYEMSSLARLREPSQLALFRVHGMILGTMVVFGLLASPFLSTNVRRGWAVLLLGYAIRASIWIAGSNLPLVPGDSCHYVEVASSIYHGEGPVKHYVESFFTDYRAGILRDGAVLDDWATPLFSYLLAFSYRATGVVPGDSLEATLAVAKGLSFALNLLTLPVVGFFATRRFGARAGLGSMAVLAILPVHALYGGFELRESLVTLTSVLAVGSLVESWRAEGKVRWGWVIVSGIMTGLAILSRNTAMALAAAAGLYGLISQGRRGFAAMIAWGIIALTVLVPWGVATTRAYGWPFHTYTSYFPYNFSWAVHHYEKGNTLASQFYTRANAPEIVRVKIKAVVIIAVYSTMILSLPLTLGFFRRLRTAERGAGHADWLVAWIGLAFVAGTLANVADVTQVEQLGRYYVPLFVLMIPSAVAGAMGWMDDRVAPQARPMLAVGLAAILWASPSWAFDFTWLSRNYQLHWPALREAGEFVRSHPGAVPPGSRIMTWFPWEFRLASRRTTILMNRSYSPTQIDATIRGYAVTHLLWGSFEPSPDFDPELWGPDLTRRKAMLELTPGRELFRTPARSPDSFPVILYRLGEDRR